MAFGRIFFFHIPGVDKKGTEWINTPGFELQGYAHSAYHREEISRPTHLIFYCIRLMEIQLNKLWHQHKNKLAQHIPTQQFQTWIQPIELISSTSAGNAQHITLSVPSEFHRDWIARKYGEEMQLAIDTIAGEAASYSFVVVESTVLEVAKVTHGDIQSTMANANMNSASIKNPVGSALPKRSETPRRIHRASGQAPPSKSAATPFKVRPESVPGSVPQTLNPRYTFDAFIEADCNRLARSAGVAVANRPGETSFNPFLIYGKVGLGKTHLAHAIGNQIVGENSRSQVLYLTSEAFTNSFVHAIKNNTLGEFTHAFRQIDVLIVDDIQFFGGKEKTQEQFFHLFNDLHQRGKQIILCADRSPAEIAGIEERLLSRFRWGLSADVQPPDLETRTAILQKHALDKGLNLTGEVIDYIAFNVKDNIRLLEGAFNRLLALQQVTQRPIDLIFVQDALQDLIDNRTRKSISASHIRDIVAEFYSLDPDLLIGKSRKRPIVDARQVAMHFCKLMTQHSLEAIGRRFGGRDHSTVIHACKAIQARIDTDPRFVEDLERIDQILKNRILHN